MGISIQSRASQAHVRRRHVMAASLRRSLYRATLVCLGLTVALELVTPTKTSFISGTKIRQHIPGVCDQTSRSLASRMVTDGMNLQKSNTGPRATKQTMRYQLAVEGMMGKLGVNTTAIVQVERGSVFPVVSGLALCSFAIILVQESLIGYIGFATLLFFLVEEANAGRLGSFGEPSVPTVKDSLVTRSGPHINKPVVIRFAEDPELDEAVPPTTVDDRWMRPLLLDVDAAKKLQTGKYASPFSRGLSNNGAPRDPPSGGSSAVAVFKKEEDEEVAHFVATGTAIGTTAMSTLGGGVGMVAGGAAGAIAGVAAAPFTIGLSVPVGAAVGAGIGFVTGTVEGGAIGGMLGRVTSASLAKDQQTQLEVLDEEVLV